MQKLAEFSRRTQPAVVASEPDWRRAARSKQITQPDRRHCRATSLFRSPNARNFRQCYNRIKSLGGAKLNLVVADTGPSIETTTNAAQRLLSQRGLSAFMCCFLSSFSLAASEIGERQQVPMLTFSYSDELVRRGYKYIFRDS